MTEIAFQKWEATGNDFLFVNTLTQSLSASDLSPRQTRNLCHRTEGIGADGIVLYSPPDGAPAHMQIINSDGSLGGMCGNALRCLALILHEETGKTEHRVRLTQRDVKVRVTSDGRPEVMMGEVSAIEGTTLLADLPTLAAQTGRTGHLVSFGNPHYVTPVTSLPDNWESLGQALQQPAHQALSTGGINAGFVVSEPGPDGIFDLRVYERGAGATLSCGSGACAASAVLHRVCGISPPHRLRLPGGVLEIGREGDNFTLSGPANLEFLGSWKQES